MGWRYPCQVWTTQVGEPACSPHLLLPPLLQGARAGPFPPLELTVPASGRPPSASSSPAAPKKGAHPKAVRINTGEKMVPVEVLTKEYLPKRRRASIPYSLGPGRPRLLQGPSWGPTPPPTPAPGLGWTPGGAGRRRAATGGAHMEEGAWTGSSRVWVSIYKKYRKSPVLWPAVGAMIGLESGGLGLSRGGSREARRGGPGRGPGGVGPPRSAAFRDLSVARGSD